MSNDPIGPDDSPVLDRHGLQIISPEECTELLGDARVGRVAFVVDGEPMIVPVNVALWGKSVVFRTAPGSKLDAAIMDRHVAFEIDGLDPEQHTGWSVVVRGTMSTVTEGREIDGLDRLGPVPWSHPESRHHWVRIQASEITGRRIPAAR